MLVSASFLGAALTACSSTDTTPGTTADDAGGGGTDAKAASDGKATTDAGDTDSGDGSAACNTIANTATEATSTSVKGNAPAATGGTIAPGTYFLKDFTLYDPAGNDEPPTAIGLKTTLVIAGAVMDSVQDFGDGVDQTFSETFIATGTKLDRTLTCPKPGPDLAAVYSVTGSNLVIYETDPKSKLVAGSTYVKQ